MSVLRGYFSQVRPQFIFQVVTNLLSLLMIIVNRCRKERHQKIFPITLVLHMIGSAGLIFAVYTGQWRKPTSTQ